MEYQTLIEEGSHGSLGNLSVRIEVAGTNIPDLNTDDIRDAAYTAKRLVANAVSKAVLLALPSTPAAVATNKELVNLFSEPVFVEEIPNGYCSDWCCTHLPWFVVTTKIGRFTIGWRKRVIAIDWEQTRGTATAEELFPAEKVTKCGRSIHAWSTEDAQRYIATVVASAQD
jgi:hypothetical protein